MLMASYNKKYQSEGKDYRAQATSSIGYQISKDGGTNWATYYSGMLSDSLYVLQGSNGANAMWLASPSAGSTNHVMHVYCGGHVYITGYTNTSIGFRPLACLKSDIQLEVDGDGYKIK